jgi:hypothetical protein
MLAFTSASQWKSNCQFVCPLPLGKNKQHPYQVINTKKVRIVQFLKQEHDGICVQRHTEKSSGMKQKTRTLNTGNKHSFARALVLNETNGKSDHSIATVGPLFVASPYCLPLPAAKGQWGLQQQLITPLPCLMVELNTKRGQMAFSSIDDARWRTVTFVFAQNVLTVQLPQQFIQV